MIDLIDNSNKEFGSLVLIRPPADLIPPRYAVIDLIVTTNQIAVFITITATETHCSYWEELKFSSLLWGRGINRKDPRVHLYTFRNVYIFINIHTNLEGNTS